MAHISMQVSSSLINKIYDTRPPRLARSPRPGPCLDFGFQYALSRNNRSKKIGVEYWPCLAQIRCGGPVTRSNFWPKICTQWVCSSDLYKFSHTKLKCSYLSVQRWNIIVLKMTATASCRGFFFFFRDKLLADEQMNPFFQQMGLGSKLNFQFFKSLLTLDCRAAGTYGDVGTCGLHHFLSDTLKVS